MRFYVIAVMGVGVVFDLLSLKNVHTILLYQMILQYKYFIIVNE
jgi:hypothetical protein